MWDHDLTKVPGLEAKVLEDLNLIREKGAEAAYAAAVASSED